MNLRIYQASEGRRLDDIRSAVSRMCGALDEANVLSIERYPSRIDRTIWPKYYQDEEEPIKEATVVLSGKRSGATLFARVRPETADENLDRLADSSTDRIAVVTSSEPLDFRVNQYFVAEKWEEAG